MAQPNTHNSHVWDLLFFILVNLIIQKSGVLHSPLLKGFRPWNLQVKENVYPTIQTTIYSTIKHGIYCPYKISNVVWTYARSVCICSLSNAKSGGPLIQLTSFMQIMIVPCAHYVCERILTIHIISICVHNHSSKCSIHVITQPLYIHYLNMYTHLYAIWKWLSRSSD